MSEAMEYLENTPVLDKIAIHKEVIEIDSFTGKVCKSVSNIVDVNPYIGMTKEELAEAFDMLQIDRGNNIFGFLVYKILIDHFTFADRLYINK